MWYIINMLEGFSEIGYYHLRQDGIADVVLGEGVQKHLRLSLVYMLVVDEEIKYIGKTIQGYIRPLSYHKNRVMSDVNGGITEECSKGRIVKIYARKFDEPFMYEGLELDLCEAYEQALISRYKPQWNNHIR